MIPVAGGKFCNLRLFAVVFSPLDVIFAAILCYVVLPLWSLKVSVMLALKNKNDEASRNFFSGAKLVVDLLGEAIPQVILSIVFVSNNPDFVFECIPTTLVSIIFSVGSILIGIYNGCIEVWKR